ncbi:EamA family transporter [Streptomyces albidoflavus]
MHACGRTRSWCWARPRPSWRRQPGARACGRRTGWRRCWSGWHRTSCSTTPGGLYEFAPPYPAEAGRVGVRRLGGQRLPGGKADRDLTAALRGGHFRLAAERPRCGAYGTSTTGSCATGGPCGSGRGHCRVGNGTGQRYGKTAVRERGGADPGVWLRLSVASVLLCVVPFLLFSWAEQHLDSGMESILNVTTPLLPLAVGAVALVGEQLERRGTAGLLAGFVGVLVLIGPSGLAGGSSPSSSPASARPAATGSPWSTCAGTLPRSGCPRSASSLASGYRRRPRAGGPPWLAEPQAWGGQRLRGHPPH